MYTGVMRVRLHGWQILVSTCGCALALPVVPTAIAAGPSGAQPHGALPSASSTAPDLSVVVEVVDEKGAPLEGAVVEGRTEYNPGPVASTCCTTRMFAKGSTGKDGRVILTSPPFTFRPVHLWVSYRDWPLRDQIIGYPSKGEGRHRLVVGPLRDVQGQLDLGAACVPKEVLVSAWPPTIRAPVGRDGSFVLRGVAPWARVWVNACGKSQSLDLEEHPERPLLLASFADEK